MIIRNKSVLIGILILACFARPVLAQLFVRPVVRDGQQAVGAEPGQVFSQLSQFSLPTINNSGEVVFRASLTGSGINTSNRQGVWAGTTGDVRLVARQGNSPPGVPVGVNFYPEFGTGFVPLIDDYGSVSFSAPLTGPGVDTSNRTGIWSESVGALSLLAREGDQAAGLPVGITYASIPTTISFNESGNPSFATFLAGPGINTLNDSAIFSATTGALSVVAREGEQAIGFAPGVKYGQVAVEVNPPINAAGDLVFAAPISGPGVTGNAIWHGRSGQLSVVARSGDPAPGLAAGVTFSVPFGSQKLGLNSTGHVFFESFVSGAGINTLNDSGIWLRTSAATHLIAHEDDLAPGSPTGGRFGSTFHTSPFLNSLSLNSSDQFAFLADLRDGGFDSSDRGIWTGTPEEGLSMVAIPGLQAPGAAPGVVFNDIFDPIINNLGQVLFEATLAGPGITSANDKGLWARDQFGQLMLVMREGSPVEISPGVYENVQSFQFGEVDGGGTDDGRPMALNDAGDLVFAVKFSGLTPGGIFVARIPEPSTAILCGAILFFSGLGRRSRPRR